MRTATAAAQEHPAVDGGFLCHASQSAADPHMQAPHAVEGEAE